MVKTGTRWRQEENPYKIHDGFVEFFFFKRDRTLHEKTFVVDLCDFEKVKSYRWCMQIKKYAYNTEVGLLHRFLVSPGEGFNVDHKDGNGFNNRRSNLRTCNQTQNLGNSKIPKTNKTGYKGVYTTENSQKPRTCPFMSKIQFQKKHIHIGYYMTAEEAARAYDQKAKELFGEFAKTNF